VLYCDIICVEWGVELGWVGGVGGGGGGDRFRVVRKVQHIGQNAAHPRNSSADLSTSNFG